MGNHHNPLTGLNAGGPLKCAFVHGSINVNGVSFYTRNGVEDDVGVNQPCSVKLVGDCTEHINESSADFNVGRIRTVVNRVSALVFGFVVDGFVAFFLNGHVVDIPDGHEDTPHTLIIGHHRCREV